MSKNVLEAIMIMQATVLTLVILHPQIAKWMGCILISWGELVQWLGCEAIDMVSDGIRRWELRRIELYRENGLEKAA